MSESEPDNGNELRSLQSTPTWSVATILTVFVAVSLLVERSIHRLSNWLRKTNRKPLLAAVEKMKEELMLLGFISLLLTATSSIISNICLPSKFYNSKFAPCGNKEVAEEAKENEIVKGHRLLMALFMDPHSQRRILTGLDRNTCPEDYEPFVSYEGLEQLHRFIFVMAITHVSYSCLTMLLAIVKIHNWRKWEDEAHLDRHNSLSEITRALTMQRQSTFVRAHTSNPMHKNSFLVWVTCFFRQFGHSVARADYLTLRQGFVTNHNLTSKYDFHSYMIRSVEEEFQQIVGVSAPLWGFVVAFMLFNVKRSNLYFWVALIPVILVLLVGTKLQHVIATLALESAGISASFSGPKFRPRDELFWFNKPELLLSLIHFILFQNAFELASFFWFWWQFGYGSCFISNHSLVYIRLILGFAGQFLCSYSTLPLYALVTQMGTNYKAALIPKRIRDTIHGWGKAARRRRRLGIFTDDPTVHTDTSTVISVEEDDNHLIYSPRFTPHSDSQIELQPNIGFSSQFPVANETSSRIGTPLLRPSASISSPVSRIIFQETIPRSSSMPH
ncbi:MLO-like protein 11 [Orobanche hederae]